MMLDQKILIEFKGEQAREFLTLFRDIKQFISRNGLSIANQQNQQKEPIRGIEGLAKFLKCSPVTAQKLKNSGKIPYSQYGRVVMFDPEKVMAALEANKK